MKLLDFIKLIVKHKVLLLSAPILIGLLVMLLTTNPNRKYYSQTMLFTGLASGSSIDMDKSFNYFATNIAFDNLINIVNSRETQEEVAIRLLSQHLLLEGPNERFISVENYNQLKSEIPEDIYKYVVKTNKKGKTKNELFNDTIAKKIRIYPKSVSNSDYEKTVTALTDLMKSNNSNFVYSLLNFEHPIYSLEAISKVRSTRISNSDLVRISFEADDPGICQQTLAIFNEVCIKKYKDLKENGSDAVVQYFTNQLSLSQKNLSSIEDRLLKFNQENSIINYYEQSKAVAIVKEEMEVEYNKKRADLAGSEASSIGTWADTVTRSTYAIADSGWKYQYDKYNDVYVYVPLNADTAGCMARNDANQESWLSPAGFNNGRIQNLVRLAYNPTQADRDTLYKIAVNPVITQVGRGTVLFGDKTFVTRNTSTNRLNVNVLSPNNTVPRPTCVITGLTDARYNVSRSV